MEEDITGKPEATRKERIKLRSSASEGEALSIFGEKPRSLALLYDELEKQFNEANIYYQPRQITETSLERIERKLDELRKEVATRDDIIEQTKQLLNHQEEMNYSLQEKISILRSMQESNVPHKRLAKYSVVFLMFFIFSFLSRIFFNVTVVMPFWNNLGLLLSFGFFVMSLAMRIDWKQKTDNIN